MSKQFKITIKKYFEIKGKNYKKTTIDHSILFDPLVDELPNSNKWLLIALIMIAGEHGNSTVTLSERRVNELLKTKEGAENALLSLQQYQVLSYEKIDSNRIEKNRIEKNRKEIPARSEVVQKTDSELNKKIWESYAEAYRHRWNVEPVRNASVNAKISQLGKRLGQEAMEVVRFYISLNDPFFIKKRHDIGLCLSDAEALRTQMVGRVEVESKSKTQATVDRLRSQAERVMKGEL